MKKSLKGFTYTVNQKQVNEYRSWPPERRLQWLFMANQLRKYLPEKTIRIQEAFRQAKI